MTMTNMLRKYGPSLLVAAFALTLAATPARAVGTRATTAITNTARVDFKDVNGNNLTQNSNTVTTIVSQVGGVNVAPNNGPVTLNPGDTFYFPHTVTNTGNFDDYANMTGASGSGWTVAIYKDTNGNGVFDAGDVLLTDSAGDPDIIPDTGLLANDGTLKILVAVTVPAGTADGATDTTTVTGTSAFDATKTSSATDKITVRAPNLSVVKSVLPAGNQPPGTVLTYTIVVTNNGTGNANSVVVTDPIPANTTYQAGTITYNAAARTDAADGDNADYNVTNAGKITATVGTLASGGATATVTFQVKIN